MRFFLNVNKFYFHFYFILLGILIIYFSMFISKFGCQTRYPYLPGFVFLYWACVRLVNIRSSHAYAVPWHLLRESSRLENTWCVYKRNISMSSTRRPLAASIYKRKVINSVFIYPDVRTATKVPPPRSYDIVIIIIIIVITRGAWRSGHRWCWRFAVGDRCIYTCTVHTHTHTQTHKHTFKAREKVYRCVCVCVWDGGGVVLNGVAAAAAGQQTHTHTHTHRCIPLGLATMVFKRRWPAAAAVHVHLPRGIYLSTRPPTPRHACPWIAPRTAHRTPETCIIIILLLLCSHDESKTTTTAAADFGYII